MFQSLRSDKHTQKKVDDRLAELERNAESKGKYEKLKLKRDGSVKVLVENLGWYSQWVLDLAKS